MSAQGREFLSHCWNKGPELALRFLLDVSGRARGENVLTFESGSGKLAPRANWKGFLKIGEVTCPVALFTVASTSERIALHTINRASGHRVHRQFVDAETDDPVDRENQVKGYETAKGEYVMIEPDELAAAVPESDKTLSVSAFIGCTDKLGKAAVYPADRDGRAR
jgi:Ku70/Ku80 beta-barrel domain